MTLPLWRSRNFRSGKYTSWVQDEIFRDLKFRSRFFVGWDIPTKSLLRKTFTSTFSVQKWLDGPFLHFFISKSKFFKFFWQLKMMCWFLEFFFQLCFRKYVESQRIIRFWIRFWKVFETILCKALDAALLRGQSEKQRTSETLKRCNYATPLCTSKQTLFQISYKIDHKLIMNWWYSW